VQHWSHPTIDSGVGGGDVVSGSARAEQWVLLAYRLPRVPSTPRSTVWRKLKRLGVAQITDGLVALPADDRTQEALEWIAEEVVEHDGEAMVWLGRPADADATSSLRERMTAALVAEYTAVTAEAAAHLGADAATRRRVTARLRRELHRIDARDFFTPPDRDIARRAVDDLAATPSVQPAGAPR
jgi:hypothetical protein